MPEIIDVYCQPEFDPPNIVIMLVGNIPIVVSTQYYEALRLLWPELPANPCASE